MHDVITCLPTAINRKIPTDLVYNCKIWKKGIYNIIEHNKLRDKLLIICPMGMSILPWLEIRLLFGASFSHVRRLILFSFLFFFRRLILKGWIAPVANQSWCLISFDRDWFKHGHVTQFWLMRPIGKSTGWFLRKVFSDNNLECKRR